MQIVYRYIEDNPSRFYLFSKMANSLLFFLLFWVTGATQESLLFKVLLVTFIVSLFTTLFWGTIYTNRAFEKNVAKILTYIDIPIIFFLIFPLIPRNNFYLILPIIQIITIALLFEKNERKQLLAVFFAVFTASSFMFGISGEVAEPAGTFISQLFIFALVLGSTLSTTNTIKNLQAKHQNLEEMRQRLSSKAKTLEKQLKVSRQHAEVLNKDVRKRDMEIQNILSLSGQLKMKNDSRDVLMSFLLTAIGQIGSEHALLMTRAKKDQYFLKVYLQKGLRMLDMKRIRFYLDSNLIELLNSVREPLLVNQIPQETLYVDEVKILNLFKDDLICPVFVKGNLSAIFIIGKKITGMPFAKDDVNLISIIANQTSFVLEQTQMTHDYRDFYSKTMKAMLNSLEAKYTYSRGHNMRTATYVNILSREMGISSREISDFSSGALLHDIGKAVVPDKYLLNSAKFSDKNYILKEKILEHTLEGSKILKAAGFNDTIVDMALHHHEFYNGKGYPHKVGREELALGTRILSVCNAYDAMTSERPYRRALPVSVAKENMRMLSGVQFDPEIVKIFLDQVEHNPKMQRNVAPVS